MTPTSLVALACAALLAPPMLAQEAVPADGDLSITVEEGIAPSLLDVLLALEQVDDATLLIGEGARAALAETPCGLTESLLVEGDDALLFVEELLRWGGFVISELGAADGALIGVHWVRGEDGTNAHYRAVDAKWLAKLSGHAALLVETVVELPHLDARQVANSLRALLRPEWCNALLSAGEHTIVLRGPAEDVAEWAATLGRLEDVAAGARGSGSEAQQAQGAAVDEPAVAALQPTETPDPDAPRSALEGAEVLLAAIAEVARERDVKLTMLSSDVRDVDSAPRVRVIFEAVGAGTNGLEATAVLLALRDAIQERAPGAEIRFDTTSEAAPEREDEPHRVVASGARVTFPPFVPRAQPPALASEGELRPAFLVRQAAVDPDHEIGVVNLKTKHVVRRDGSQTIEIHVDPVGRGRTHELAAVRGFLADLDRSDSPFSVSSLAIFTKEPDSTEPGWDFQASVLVRTAP